jgi:Ca-activated chloride channel homolog
VELVATRLRQPLLTDVRVSVEGGGGNVRLSRLYPAGEQDIFAGQDLVLLARYEGSGPARVQVRGRSGGSEVRWTSERHFPREERENAFVPRLWATQRIGWLSAEKRRNGGSREIDDEIRQLGEQFGIPTEFTSYLVLEPGMVAGMGAGSRQSANRVDSSRARIRGIPISGTSGGAAGMSPAAAPMVAQFESAREAAAQRTAKSLAAADQAVSANPDATRRAGQRVFVLDAGSWVDARFKPELRVYKVKAYSPEYFTLIERLPELREAFAVGDRVLVAGRTVAVEVADDAAQLGDRDIQAIVREFQLP